MRRHLVEELARFANARLVGDHERLVGPDVLIDSRAVTPGSLFVAIAGERFDGHDYVAQAAAAGAGAVLVSRQLDVDVPQLVVEDTVAGLTRLAAALVTQAQETGLVSVGLTGSSGKTSTKDILAQVLADAGQTVAPPGSLNNEIGVPLTACRVDEESEFLVSEMGARGIGHIAHLCGIVHPSIGLVLNVGVAHLGEFGGVEATQRAKGELVECLPAEGWAILNADDERVSAMAARTNANVGYFSVDSAAAPETSLLVQALDITLDERSRANFSLRVTKGANVEEFDVALNLVGAHQAANAAAAAAVAIAAGISPAAVAESLGRVTVKSAWRMALSERDDQVLVLNDAYNANPDSMRAALNTLAALVAGQQAKGFSQARGIAVLGDMLELGAQSAQLHHQVGASIRGDLVLAVGEFAPQIVAGAASVGVPGRVVNAEDVVSVLELAPGDVVVIKASRGLGLESVASDLLRGVNE